MGKDDRARGFGSMVLLLALLLLAVIALSGTEVYLHRKTTASNPPNYLTTPYRPAPVAATKEFVDSSKVFRLRYPATWTEYQQAPGDGVGGIGALQDDQLTGFVPPNAPKLSSAPVNSPDALNSVTVMAFQSSNPKSVLNGYGLNGTPQSVTINGYPALYQHVVSMPDYTDDYYAVTHNGITVLLAFREKQGKTVNTGNVGFDATDIVPAFNAIAKSVTFTN